MRFPRSQAGSAQRGWATVFAVTALALLDEGYGSLILVAGALTAAAFRQGDADATLRTILDHIGDAVVVTDRESRIREMNRTAERLTGWREAESRGRCIEELFRLVIEGSRTAVENPVRAVLRDGTAKRPGR